MRDFFEDLIEYTGKDKELVRSRCNTARVELAWLWEKAKDDPIKYYRETDLYIFELTNYQNEMRNIGFHNWYKDMIRKYKWKTMLDYGGGIGETTIVAKEEKVETTFLDIKNSHTMKYAKWRFKKYGIETKILNEESKITEKYDFVMAMDVFEHMKEPGKVIKDLSKRTKYIFANPEKVPFDWMYPQHITHCSLRPYFRNIMFDLWESDGS